MQLPEFRKPTMAGASTVSDVQRIFNDLAQLLGDALKPLLANPRAKSTVQRVTLNGGANTVVNHKLPIPIGRTPSGWAITDISAAATVFRVTWTATTITLFASAGCSAQIEVW